jgi:hypothetical protein
MKAIFEFEDSIYAAFKAACKKAGHPMVWVLTEFMKQYVEIKKEREAGK